MLKLEPTLKRVGPVPSMEEPPIKRMPTKIKDNVEFFAHQRAGVRTLCRRSSWLLADEQGLGKTVQSLTVAALDFDQGWASRILVICDASLKWNWAAEIEQMTNYTYHVLEGTPVERKQQLNGFDSDIMICNYEQVMKDSSAFMRLRPDICIVDECHAIKNYEAKRTKAVHRLMPKRWFLLTGTPLETRPDELWSPLRLCDPENTQGYWAWVNNYCVFAPGTRKVVGVKHKDQLREKIDGIFLRRLKDDCLDLPPKQYVKVNVELSKYQRQLHDQAQEELWLDLPDDPEGMDLESGLMRALRLRQICSTPANIEGYGDDSAKLDVCIAKLQELLANGHKVGVFTQFRPTLRCLANRMTLREMPFWLHHGDMKAKEKQEAVDEWTRHDGPAVIAGMYQTMGRGLTLTAANHCIMVDKRYGPGQQAQAEDRFHRIGTTGDSVQIIELIAHNTYEQRVEQILYEKGVMIDELIPNSGWKKKVYEAILAGRGGEGG